MQKLKIYIAGRISGDKNYKEKFDRAAKEIEADGNIVLNPAVLPEGMRKSDYMRICFSMIDSADIVAFLPDFSYCNGAIIEYQYCNYIGKTIKYI